MEVLNTHHWQLALNLFVETKKVTETSEIGY